MFNKKILIIAIIIILVIVTCVVSKIVLSPDKISSFEVNSSSLADKMLIASQGTDFKTSLVDNIISKFEQKNYYIKVLDISELGSENSSNYDKVLILATCIGRNIPGTVKKYIKNNNDNNQVVLVVTSGSNWKPSLKADTITAASKIEDIDNKVNQILNIFKSCSN